MVASVCKNAGSAKAGEPSRGLQMREKEDLAVFVKQHQMRDHAEGRKRVRRDVLARERLSLMQGFGVWPQG